eukprot:8824255-Alexandrium_andersonii.AAC.1
MCCGGGGSMCGAWPKSVEFRARISSGSVCCSHVFHEPALSVRDRFESLARDVAVPNIMRWGSVCHAGLCLEPVEGILRLFWNKSAFGLGGNSSAKIDESSSFVPVDLDELDTAITSP